MNKHQPTCYTYAHCLWDLPTARRRMQLPAAGSHWLWPSPNSGASAVRGYPLAVGIHELRASPDSEASAIGGHPLAVGIH